MEGYISWCPTGIHTRLFIIQHTFMCLFYCLEDLDIAIYADDTTIYTVTEKKESVIRALETTS